MVKLSFFQVGFCQHIEALSIKGGKWKNIKFPALVALIEHPHYGKYLFDTGYSDHFFKHTQHFPGKLYAWITPVTCHEKQSMAAQLADLHFNSQDIQGIILSHFHADHIAGINDFPNTDLHCLKEGYISLAHDKPWRSLFKGFLPGLLPKDCVKRMKFIDDKSTVDLSPRLSPFDKGYDLFGDNSVIAVPLPGHAKGQVGLLCQTVEQCYFLVADAAWHKSAITDLLFPHPLTNLITDDMKAYRDTLIKLHHCHKNHPHICMVPSHCRDTLATLLRRK